MIPAFGKTSRTENNKNYGIDAVRSMFSYDNRNRLVREQQIRSPEVEEVLMNKTINAIALIAGMAGSVPAFAQTPDPAANAVVDGTGGAATGALIGCIVTIPIGCAPGAAVGAAIGGGVGATAGVVSTPPVYYPPPPPPAYVPPPPGS
ncbi:MAG TPA: hypothetical protein VGS13_14965 [Stellaceae bacterium]|nr:hypothetical protein [Stellaceae bacterium]